MKNIWDEREKAFENQYIYELEKKQSAQRKERSHEEQVRALCKNRCPKCGDEIEATTFRGVPLDQCPSCEGIWLGPNDLKILAEKDHRTWFDTWFKQARKEEVPTSK